MNKPKLTPEEHQATRAVANVSSIDLKWRERLIMSSSRPPSPRAILANAVTALTYSPEWRDVLAFDEFAIATVVQKQTPWGERPAEWNDHQDRLACDWLQHSGIHVSTEIAGQAVDVVSKQTTFHPVREYLTGLKWDGVKRLDYWPCLYLGALQSPYISAVGARWALSAVARIYRPGCKADCAIIPEGPQGKGKSRALKALGGKWFTDELADFGSKDAAMQTRGTWIIEIAELDAMSRSESGRIKAFMSRTTDRFRPPYGRRLIESPRQCVFAGTSNHAAYLKDETGARRFWPIQCGEIKVEELEADRDQIWAEAVRRFGNGEIWWLDTPELNQTASVEQSERYESDAWDETIGQWLSEPTQAYDRTGHPITPFSSRIGSVSVTDILTHCIRKPLDQWTQADKNRVARSLQAQGWERYRRRVNGLLTWEYKPGDQNA